jgi:glycosyltransferase involved in cell wall biosynthesis
LTTSAFGGEQTAHVLRAWEPLALYRFLFNRQARAGLAPSFARTDAGPFKGLVRALRTRVLIPDAQMTWLPSALLMALRRLRRQRANLIYSTYPPASAHLLGLLLKRLTGLPWVADFRDSWVSDPLDPALEESPGRRAVEQRLEKIVVCRTDALVAATEIIAGYLGHDYPEAARRIRVITNGFEPDGASGQTLPAPSVEGPLRLLHTGSFSLSHARRTPRPLLAALQELLAQDPGWAGKLHVALVGPLTQAEKEAAAPLVRAGMVRLEEPQAREAVLARQRQAHVLLLIDHVRSCPSSNVPGKFYEYLAAQRPILSLGGPGMVERLLGRLRAGLHVPGNDVQAIRRALEELHARFLRQELRWEVDEGELRRFHRRYLARQLALCFDELVEGRLAR